jgi:hypothetical protein
MVAAFELERSLRKLRNSASVPSGVSLFDEGPSGVTYIIENCAKPPLISAAMRPPFALSERLL